MSPASINRPKTCGLVLATLSVLSVAGLAVPATAVGASPARCVVQGVASGSPASLRSLCPATRPTQLRTVGTAFRRSGATCQIAHLGALDPAAYRRVC